MAGPLHLRIFLSSPGDVAAERELARRLIKDELPYNPLLRGRVTLDVLSWDDPAAGVPLLATVTPQEAVNQGLGRPADCDITVVILWARLGSQLRPGRLPQARRRALPVRHGMGVRVRHHHGSGPR